MSQPIYVVDAFTQRAFAGNPAAVCPLTHEADPTWMQAVANEMNLAETAFVAPRGDGSWNLRWFTPTVEVALCGHATLASAFLLWHTGRVDRTQPVRFHTRQSGVLTCTQVGELIEMDFPAVPATATTVPGLAELLGTTPLFIGQNGMDLLAVVGSEEAVRTWTPDFTAIAKYPVRGLIVTAKATGDYDFVSRFFAPQSGVPEDPVTGSAHCCLGPYWQSVLGKSELVGYQASRRGGLVRMRCVGDRVHLGGHAVLVLEGTLRDTK